MSDKKGFTTLEIILIILLIVGVIVIFVLTLGYVNLSDKLEAKEERTEREEILGTEVKEEKIPLSKLKYRHKRIKQIISKNEEVNNKLNKRFKFIYASVRVILVMLFVGLVLTLYFALGITDIGLLLTFISAVVIVIGIASYLTIGTINGVSDFLDSIKMKLETSIRSKCISIEEKLPIYREEEKLLVAAITLEEEQISISNQKNIDDKTLGENRDEVV